MGDLPLPVPRGRPRRAVAARFGGLPASFWYLWAGTLVNRLGTFVEPFLALYLTQARGLSYGATGLVLAAYGAGALLSQVVGGSLTDRLGRKPTLVGGLVASGGALLLLGAARGAPLIALAALLVGLVGDMYRPASSALVADAVDPQDRPRAYALLFWAVNLGFAVASVLAGFLASHGYGWFFAIDAATCIGFAVVIAARVREPERAAAPAHDGPRPPGWSHVLGDRLLLALVGLVFALACVYFQAYSSMPLAMRQDGLPASAYGLVIALNGIVIVLVQPLVTPLFARLDRSLLFAGANALLGSGFALLALADSTPAYALCVFAWTLGEIGGAGVAQAIVADLAPAHLRGRYLGLFGTAFGGAAMVGPALGTLVLAQAGSTALWLACGLAGVAVAGGQLAIAPAVRRRAAATP
jgi:MFS family permease